jgi:hypothetical protein
MYETALASAVRSETSGALASAVRSETSGALIWLLPKRTSLQIVSKKRVQEIFAINPM